MPIKHGGMLASRASTWLRDHFWRKTIAPRSSRPTMWNEYLPISIPITAIAHLRLSDMACSCLSRPLPASNAEEAGARPDHPISGLSHRHVSLHAMAHEPLETLQRDEIIFELNISCSPPPVPTCRIGPAPTSCVKGAWIEQAKPALERPSGRTAASRRDRARPI